MVCINEKALIEYVYSIRAYLSLVGFIAVYPT